MDFTSAVMDGHGVHSALAPPALSAKAVLRGKFTCFSILKRTANKNQEKVVDIPGTWASIFYEATTNSFTKLSDATVVLHQLGILPKLPDNVVVNIVGVHFDQEHHHQHKYFVQVQLEQRGTVLKEYKSIYGQDAKQSMDTDGYLEVAIGDETSFPLTENGFLSDVQLHVTVFKHNPIVKDSTIGTISPTISLISALSNSGTYQNCMLALQHSGKVTGKVHLRITFK